MAKDFRKISPNRLRHYNALDTASTLALYDWQKGRMGPFMETWRKLEGPALRALAQVERWGAILDEENVRRYDEFLQAKIARVAESFKAFPEIPAGFNVKSPDQMSALLGGTLKLKSPFKTDKGNPSWGGDALEELMPEGKEPAHPCLPAIREMLAARSMQSSYGVGQLKHVGYDGRVHTTYKFKRTGRLSSSAPNLQNLKKEDDDPDVEEVDDDGKWARSCWVCPPGYVWVNLDFSQNELRVGAMRSGDQGMIDAFNSGRDFHQVRASEMFAVPFEKVTKAQRRAAKVINFMIPYGATADGVAMADGMRGNVTKERAQEYIDAYAETAPVFWAYLKGHAQRAAQTGDAWGIYPPYGWTRRRPVIDIGENGDDRATRKRVAHAERVAKNLEIQFVANAFGLGSLTRVVAWIEDTGFPAQLVMTVHDNLALYVRADVWEEGAREVRRMMTDWETGPLPLKVDIEMGPRDLGHMEKVKLA